FNASERNLIAVVLNQYPPSWRHSEIRPLRVFTDCYQLLVFGRAPSIFQYLIAVQPVFYQIVWCYPDHPLIPFTNRLNSIRGLFSGHQIIQRGQGAVTIPSHFSIRMPFIVQDLIFEAHCRTLVSFGFGNEILDSAIGAFAKLKIELQLKGTEFIFRYNISAVLRLTAAGTLHHQYTVIHRPAFFRKVLFVSSTPALARFSIP